MTRDSTRDSSQVTRQQPLLKVISLKCSAYKIHETTPTKNVRQLLAVPKRDYLHFDENHDIWT